VSHLVNANKMVSDTPRTNNYDWSFHMLFAEAQKMERELNAANDRIKLLEEAGNNLLWSFCPEYTSDLTQEQSDALKQWNKAKEAKP
jgi:hypothetical protein